MFGDVNMTSETMYHVNNEIKEGSFLHTRQENKIKIENPHVFDMHWL